MADSLPAPTAAVVLAAGAGERLRPLTLLRPKPLCPVANVPLLDSALERVADAVGADAVAVNVHHHRAQMEAHLAGHPLVHVSVEEPVALGTAGALGALRPWLDGRGVLILNGDTWSTADLAAFVQGWDGERVRVLTHGEELFGPGSPVVASILPWPVVAGLEAVPSGLYERCWRKALADGSLDVARDHGTFYDCGTPRRYLEANLAVCRARLGADGGALVGAGVERNGARLVDAVVGDGAVVHGEVRASVVWPAAVVSAGEVLEHGIRTAERITVLVR
jgi:N-acetyl-alpha-D-muramate 1-phosphate uridylyltransferase